MGRNLLCAASLATLLSCAVAVHAQTEIRGLETTFQSPPDDARMMMRWWWFGPAVTKDELGRELEQMKAAGVGGFEIQPVYALELDDPKNNFHNLPYLSDEFLDDVHFVNTEAHRLGLRASLTLSSGWPYGGANTPVTEAAAQLRLVQTPVTAGADSVAVPSLSNGESLIAVFLAENNWDKSDATSPRMLPLPAPGSLRMALSPEAGARTALFFVSSRTGQQVKRPAVDADGFVLDHFSHQAVAHHLHNVADKLIAAFGDQPPYSVFSDSLEVYSADWTPDLPQQFLERRGYDLLPHLPELYSSAPSAEALAVRHDWGQTLTELVDENYLQQIQSWAAAHGTLFRSQTYGPPAVSLSSNALVDLPEGEGPQWRQFSYTRWATSASHIYGRPITSAETWTWLHSPVFRATPLDMKAEADRFFLQGINQLVGHGWPYSPPFAAEPGWHFYAAGVFNAHNPWWMVMPDVAHYMQRVSWALRQGEPANDVAVFLPEDDGYAAFTPGKVALTDVMPRWITPALTQAIEDGGYNFDYIDSAAIAARGIHYPLLILPNVNRISADTLARIEQYRAQGGKVLALGRLPAHAPGLQDGAQASNQVAAAAQALLGKPGAQFVTEISQLPQALRQMLPPDMQLSTPAPAVGFLHRKLANAGTHDADIYFVANTGNLPVHTSVHFRAVHTVADWLDADTGEARAAEMTADGHLDLDLAPYESRLLLLHDGATTDAAMNASAHTKAGSKAKLDPKADSKVVADLSGGWQVHFDGNGEGSGNAKDINQNMPALASWTENPETLYYSGVATYRKTIEVSPAQLRGGRLMLSFGEGTPTSDPPGRPSHLGTEAMLDAPIRDAAVVYVNGKRAAALWHPPYETDVTSLLQPGRNDLEVRVANTAINLLAGQALPDYHLLWERYGHRFAPQDLDNLKPLPSGLLGKIELIRKSAQ